MPNSLSQRDSGDPWTIRHLLAWTQEHLQAQAIDEPRLSAELLLAKALDCQRIDLYARFEEQPTGQQRATFRELVRAAAKHAPIAYLIGHKEFYSLEFKVTPDVLIPRPETELLVERALAWCDEHKQNRYDLLDIGTGSGCIAITIAKRQPAVKAIATDISEAALSVAAENAERHGVSRRVRFTRADLLDLPPDDIPSDGFDLIVSNPPYVSEKEHDSLPENVRQYEPHVALFGGGDGLDAYRRVATAVPRFLRPGGTMMLEVGHVQADAVTDICTKTGCLDLHGRYKDLQGIERAIQFTLRA